MRFIGITGGVGAGKSEILSYLAKQPKIRVMLADEIAHDLMKPGTSCYDKIMESFAGEDICLADGSFDKVKLAAAIFADENKRQKLNAIVHPAVREYVELQAAEERLGGRLTFLVLEAALLIEEHYDKICDELWYIYTSQKNRRERLKLSRGYSDTRIDQIFASQLSDEVYRKHCRVIIDNNGALEATLAQIDEALRREAYE